MRKPAEGKPRFGKAGFIYNLFTKNTFYKDFITAYPEYENKTWKEISETWEEIAEEFREQIAKNPLGVKMKYYIGELKYQYLPYKFKVRRIDNKTQETIRELNLHNRGKTGILKWERRWAVRYNKWLQYFAFDACNKLKTKAKEMVNENPEGIRISRITTGRRLNK